MTERVMYTSVRQVLVETDERGLARVLIEQETFGSRGLTVIDTRADTMTVTADRTIDDDLREVVPELFGV